MQIISFGPFMLKWELLMLIVSVIAGYAVLYIRLKRSGLTERKSLLDVLSNTVLICILIWKFSTLIFNFQSVIHYPLSLLYFTGGTKGIVLAFICGMIILAYKTKKHDKPWTYYLDPLLTWFIAGYAMLSLLRLIVENGGLPAAGAFLISAAVTAYQLRPKRMDFSFYRITISVLWFSIGLFAVSLLKRTGDPLWIGFSGRQLLLIAVAVISLIIKVILEKRNKL